MFREMFILTTSFWLEVNRRGTESAENRSQPSALLSVPLRSFGSAFWVLRRAGLSCDDSGFQRRSDGGHERGDARGHGKIRGRFQRVDVSGLRGEQPKSFR